MKKFTAILLAVTKKGGAAYAAPRSLIALILVLTMLFGLVMPVLAASLDNIQIKLSNGTSLDITKTSFDGKPLYIVKTPKETTQIIVQGVEDVAVGRKAPESMVPTWWSLDVAAKLREMTPEDWDCADWNELLELFGYETKEELLQEEAGLYANETPYFRYRGLTTTGYENGSYTVSFTDQGVDQVYGYIIENTYHLEYDGTANYYVFPIEEFYDEDTANSKNNLLNEVGRCLIQVGGQEAVDTAALDALLKSAPSIEKDGDVFKDTTAYHSGDRYNGKTTVNDLKTLLGATRFQSCKGFWDMYVIARTNAETVSNKGQNAIDAAVSLLQQTADNLIPTTQINPTGLYEKLQTYNNEEVYNDTRYSVTSWGEFYSKRTQAQKLLDSLFTKDEKGNVIPTAENSSVKHPQSDVDALVDSLVEAAKALDGRVYSLVKFGSENALAGIALYASRYDPNKLNKEDYTKESWDAFVAARGEALNVAKDHGKFTTTMGISEAQLQVDAFVKLRAACHGLVENKDKIHVTVSLFDDSGARDSKATPIETYTKVFELEPGAKLGDILKAPLTPAESGWNQQMVFLNGIAYYSTSGCTVGYSGSMNPGLHDGDVVTVAKVKPPIRPNISENDQPIGLDEHGAWETVRYQRITASLTQNTAGVYQATVGVPFTLTVESAAAMPARYDGKYAAVADASVYSGAASADEQTARSAKVMNDTQLKTNADGTVTLTIYESGYQLINAYSLSDEFGTYTNGPAILIYAVQDDAVASLDKIRADLTAELRQTAEDRDHPQACFSSEAWTQLQTTYKTALDAIKTAETAPIARAAQMNAIVAIKQLQADADRINAANLARFRALMSEFPADLGTLDDSFKSTANTLQSCYNAMTDYQLGELSKQETDRYAAIIAACGKELPEAQPRTLTVEYDLDGVPEADRADLFAMIQWLQKHAPVDGTNGTTGGVQLPPLFSYNTIRMNSNLTKTIYTRLEQAEPGTKVSFCFNPTFATYFHIRGARKDSKNGPDLDKNGLAATEFPYLVEGNNYAISAPGSHWMIEDHWTRTDSTEVPHFYVNGHEYEIRGITFSGVAEEDITTPSYDVFDMGDYGSDYKAYRIMRSFDTFTMPNRSVVATVTWVPVGGTSAEVESAREAAKSALLAALNAYGEDHKNYSDIKAKYDMGLTKLDQATTVEQINELRKATVKAMADAAASITSGSDIVGWEYDSAKGKLFYPGPQVGTVTVTIENRTNDGSATDDEANKAALEHFYTSDEDYAKYGINSLWLHKVNYPIGEYDSMMTVVLRALVDEGCTWSGTGGNGKKDYDFEISYLSTITDVLNGGHSLAEFTGGSESGWMGTLNDWFTNEGFNNFTVKNKKLADGDVISIKYTSNGLGADVGGTWGNSDTTLASLSVSGSGNPRLIPTFTSGAEGGTYAYTLVIDGESDDLTVTPVASNKNFLVKTFLNEKVTSNVEGSSYYKPTESIPVTTGDTIYIGCGSADWPSMNNQSGNTQTNDGTWYILRVISASGSYQTVEEQLRALPRASAVIYGNHELYTSDIAKAEAAYYALISDQQALVSKTEVENLLALTQKIQRYQELKAFKAAVKALPTPANVTLADSETILRAQREYEAIRKDAELFGNLAGSEIDKMDQLSARLAQLNEEARHPVTTVTVTPDTITATVNGTTITLTGYCNEGDNITLRDQNGTILPVQNGIVTVKGVTYVVDMTGVVVKPATVNVTETAPTVSAPTTASTETKAAAQQIGNNENTGSQGLGGAAADKLVEEGKSKAEDVETEPGQTVEVTATPKLEIKVVDLEQNEETEQHVLTLEITPQVTYTTTVKNENGSTVDESTSAPETIKNRDIKAPVTISIPLPTGMSHENLFIKHYFSDRSGYEYIKPLSVTRDRTNNTWIVTWQQSSFSTVQLTTDLRRATVKLGDEVKTLLPSDKDQLLPEASESGKTFLGWNFILKDKEGNLKTYPGGPYTRLTDDLLTALANAEEITATPSFRDNATPSVPSGTPAQNPFNPDAGKDSLPFTDVNANSWYYFGVKYAYKNGLMNGTGTGTFSPNADTTRGMIVTMLARLEGQNTSGTPWYAAGQKWAMDAGISDGTNMTGAITREQLAAILFRYAKQKGYDVSKSADLNGFADANTVSTYAADAMRWAVANGLIQGSNSKLNPKGTATRAQVATILMRFMELYAK